MEEILKQRFLERFGICPDQSDLDRFYAELSLFQSSGCLTKLEEVAKEFEGRIMESETICCDPLSGISIILGLLGIRPGMPVVRRQPASRLGEVIVGRPALPFDLRIGEVTLLAGRPMTGKTSLACKAAALAAADQNKVLYFALDEPLESLSQIIFGGSNSRVSENVILDDTSEAVMMAESNSLCAVIPNCMEDRFELMCDIHTGIKLVVIDFMQAFSYNHNTMSRLKKMAVKYGCSVLALSAVSRVSEGHCPEMKDIDTALRLEIDHFVGTYRGCGAIELDTETDDPKEPKCAPIV